MPNPILQVGMTLPDLLWVLSFLRRQEALSVIPNLVAASRVVGGGTADFLMTKEAPMRNPLEGESVLIVAAEEIKTLAHPLK